MHYTLSNQCVWLRSTRVEILSPRGTFVVELCRCPISTLGSLTMMIRGAIRSRLDVPFCRIQGSNAQRYFGVKRKASRPRKNKNAPKKKAVTKVPRARRLPPGVFMAEEADSLDSTTLPPVYLSVTASPFAFIASCAAEENEIDPQSLFVDEDEEPKYFFADYVSPKDFKHELPKWNLPEVAFLGRSNVGKSSLVNALLRNDLARCSKQPGRTQHVNYFGLFPSQNFVSPAEAAGFLVDLPGYGYAKAPPEQVQKWQTRTQNFLLQRRNAGVLRRLFLLVDSRRGNSQIDRDIMGWFDEATIPYSVVLTKADRVSRPQIIRFVNDVCMRHHSQTYAEGGGYGTQGPVVHVTSARDGHGIRELMTSIEAEFDGHREEAKNRRDNGPDAADEPWRDFADDDTEEIPDE